MAYQPYAPYPGPSGPPAVDPYAPQPYAYVDPYAGAPPYGAGPGGYGGDDIRTVFITGFPEDIKERELINLCRFLPDFEAASLKYKGPIAQGFALFRNGAGAQHALAQLNHLPYCEGFSLRCEMARKNMYIKSDDYGTAPKVPRTYGPGPSGPPGGGYGGGGGGFDSGAVNPPRDTLFIGNLGPDVSDADLEAFFGKLEGFKQLKAVRKDRGTTCFVQFADIASATAAHDSQQGAELPSNDRGPLRIQYSKNSLGEKRKREDGYGGYGGGCGGGYGGGPSYQAGPQSSQPHDYHAPVAPAGASYAPPQYAKVDGTAYSDGL